MTEKAPTTASAVPFLHVADPARSAAFYAHLGFTVDSEVKDGNGKLTWVWLQSRDASLMFGLADEPVEPSVQAVLLYLYTEDVQAMHAHLAARGVTVSEIRTPFYAPRGEFRVVDPDGYVVMITHAD